MSTGLPISGTVTDASGNSISGATVVAVHQGGEYANANEVVAVKTTDSNGGYQITEDDLPATYADGETQDTNYLDIYARIGSETDIRQATPIRPYQPYSLATQLDLNNLFARYDATEISGESDGGDLSSWSDQQGSNDLTAGVAPTYEASGINGNPSVVFNGVDEYMNTSFPEVSQPTHIFLVGQFITFSNQDRNFLFDSTNSSARQVLQNGVGNWVLFSNRGTVGGSSTDANIHVFSALFNGATSELRIDGVQDLSGDPGSDGLGGLTLGANFDNSINFANFRFGEILIYSADKSSNVSDIESYLADKWGVTL